jgi:uncharacterized SAM-binding protein YcdF (DUF218 family)
MIGLIMIFFFGNGFIVTEATYLWQKRAIPIAGLPVYQTAIVLAGIVPYQETALTDRVNISQGADRLLHPVQLYKIGKVQKILISGGSGTLVGDKSSEAIKLKRVLLYCGVREADIILEGSSRNTYESSVATKRLLDSMQYKGNLLLVTSASHMRRAEACFIKAGLKTDIFPVDNATQGEFYLDHMVPTELAMNSWTVLIREMIGFTVYKVMGYC